MTDQFTPWEATLERTSKGFVKIDIRNENVPWTMGIRYMAGDYDTAFAAATWDEKKVYIYPGNAPHGIVVPTFLLEDKKLKCFVYLGDAGTVQIDEVWRHVENLRYVQTVYDAVIDALHQYFPGILEGQEPIGKMEEPVAGKGNQEEAGGGQGDLPWQIHEARRNQTLEDQRKYAPIIAEYMASPAIRTTFRSYKDALGEFLERVNPVPAFRDTAIQIFADIWRQYDPEAKPDKPHKPVRSRKQK